MNQNEPSGHVFKKESFSSPRWSLRVDGPTDGEENMRLDREALEAQQHPGAAPGLRFFQWAEPTVTYGRLQKRPLALALGQAFGIQRVVQRPTGGGLVIHNKELSLSFVWRPDTPGFPKKFLEIYRKIHRTIAQALEIRDVQTTLAPAPPSPGGAPGECFREPAESDLLWNGQKVMGGALRVTRWGRLYQGDLRTDVLGLKAAALIKELTAAFERNF